MCLHMLNLHSREHAERVVLCREGWPTSWLRSAKRDLTLPLPPIVMLPGPPAS